MDRSSVATLGLLLLVGPYLVWNLVYRGDVLGMDAVWQSASHMFGYEAYGGAWSYFTGMYWVWTFESYWGRFGWINVLAPTPVYLGYLFLTGAAGVGFLLAGRSQGSTTRSKADPTIALPGNLRLYLGGATLITLASHLWVNVYSAQPQGRHLFPAAPQISIILAMGIAYLVGGRQDRIGTRSCFAVLFVLAGLALYCCLAVIIPSYR